jgi:hypothetical protein
VNLAARPDLTRDQAGEPITFQPRGPGRYVLNGERVPSVTTILSDAIPKPALIDWAARVTAEAAVNDWDDLTRLPLMTRAERLREARWKVQKEAALAGTRIHELGEHLVKGEAIDVDERFVPAIEAYARFLDRFDVQPLFVERPVCHFAHRWAGRFDLRARFRDGTDWLLDLKSSSGIFAENILQVAAYANAELVLTGDDPRAGELAAWTPPDRCGFVHIASDAVELRPVATEAVASAYTVFRHAAEVARWLKDAKDNWDELLERSAG